MDCFNTIVGQSEQSFGGLARENMGAFADAVPFMHAIEPKGE
jgi:hypothetical protein